jgi:hypothetical protein
MAEPANLPTTEWIDRTAVDGAHARANKDALLEHARMGRSVSEWRDGQVVWITPAEIFARYELDEHGRPSEHLYITDPDIIAQVEQFAWLDRLQGEGKLNQYRGQYVLAGAGQIFAHGTSLVEACREAEPKAAAAGVPLERLAWYFVPGNASFASRPARKRCRILWGADGCRSKGAPTMAEQTTLPVPEVTDDAKVDLALGRAFRQMLLEHARMGSSVPEWRNGQLVSAAPAEILARFGLDENGRPNAEPREEPPVQDDILSDPAVLAQIEQFAWLDQLQCAGQLNQYRGEFLIAGARQIFAHGSNLAEARREAEPKATAAGVPLEQLACYFVPGNA